MHVAAIIAWFVTAGGGLLMASIWIARGGLRQQEGNPSHSPTAGTQPVAATRSNLPSWLVATHATMAVVALVPLLFYASRRDDPQTGAEAAPWLALAALVVVAGFGVAMARRWAADRRERRRTRAPRGRHAPADQSIPVVVVGAHGLAAATTLVVVLLLALDIGT